MLAIKMLGDEECGIEQAPNSALTDSSTASFRRSWSCDISCEMRWQGAVARLRLWKARKYRNRHSEFIYFWTLQQCCNCDHRSWNSQLEDCLSHDNLNCFLYILVEITNDKTNPSPYSQFPFQVSIPLHLEYESQLPTRSDKFSFHVFDLIY